MSLESTLVTASTGLASEVNEIQERNATARGRVINATMALGITVDPALIEAALMELAQVWVDEAEWFAQQKRRGWKSTAEELTRCAARLRGFAVGLTTRDVQMPPEETHPPQCDCGRPTCAALELAALDALQEACSHPEASLSVRRDGSVICTACQSAVASEQLTAAAIADQVSKVAPLTADNFLPEPPPVEHHAGEIVQSAGAAWAEQIINEATLLIDPKMIAAVDNPFTSPAAPGSNRSPVKRLGYGELGQLIATTYPVPRPHLSHSYVESTERCGLSALLSDASRAGHLGPRRPSWSLIGGNAFHLAIESIERAAIELGGTSPLTTEFANVAEDWTKFWEDILAGEIDEQKAALLGTAYANPSTWHIANKQLEGFDWWRVEGLAMIKRYLEFHNNDWRSTHTLLQVPNDPTSPQPQRVPVLEFPFMTTAGSTAITAEGRIDAAWLSTAPDYPTATLEIVDHKAGKSIPSETFQLTEYADVLRRRYLPPGFALPIVGRYWLARQGRYTPPVKLDPAASQAEIDYRYTMAERKVKAGVFEPSPSMLCSGCSSVDYCPAQSMRDSA